MTVGCTTVLPGSVFPFSSSNRTSFTACISSTRWGTPSPWDPSWWPWSSWDTSGESLRRLSSFQPNATRGRDSSAGSGRRVEAIEVSLRIPCDVAGKKKTHRRDEALSSNHRILSGCTREQIIFCVTAAAAAQSMQNALNITFDFSFDFQRGCDSYDSAFRARGVTPSVV